MRDVLYDINDEVILENAVGFLEWLSFPYLSTTLLEQLKVMLCKIPGPKLARLYSSPLTPAQQTGAGRLLDLVEYDPERPLVCFMPVAVDLCSHYLTLVRSASWYSAYQAAWRHAQRADRDMPRGRPLRLKF
jgi:hypothetical protein